MQGYLQLPSKYFLKPYPSVMVIFFIWPAERKRFAGESTVALADAGRFLAV